MRRAMVVVSLQMLYLSGAGCGRAARGIPMTGVTRETYAVALDTLANVSKALYQIADTVDVTEMRRLCNEFETIAPVIRPTEFNQGGGMNLRDQAMFLAAVEDFVTTLRKLDRRPGGGNDGN